jgi:hypothetical protein
MAEVLEDIATTGLPSNTHTILCRHIATAGRSTDVDALAEYEAEHFRRGPT